MENKFIRTTKGIWEISQLSKKDYEWLKTGTHREASAIEELCDEFVVFLKGSCGGHWLPPIKDFEHTKKEYCYDEIYGAIWTEWGLKYVAKMNEKGELELL